MARRYVYDRMSKGDFSSCLNALGLTPNRFAKISGARLDTVHKCLQGGDIPTYMRRDLEVWLKKPEVLTAMEDWADENAFDKRVGPLDDEPARSGA